MFLDGVLLLSPRLQLSSRHETAELERALAMSMPPGYAEYMVTLGEGTWGGHRHRPVNRWGAGVPDADRTRAEQ